MIQDENPIETPSVSSSEKSNEHLVNYLEVKKASAILRAINHKLRQGIIKLLDEKDQITVTEIFIALRIEQSVASQHLAILRRAEFVNTIREGKNIMYSLNKEKIIQLNNFVKKLLDTKEN
ncbi:MAG: helix-turn-helix transcriptional regulator [Chitinophagaceae bacterium]|nr:helix-turn-helix transcriptional regulator [Chitinophagaceae bacterium]